MPGDKVDVMVVFNPAALKTNILDLKQNGILIANLDSFQKRNLKLADYVTNPLDDGSLSGYQVISAPITSLTWEALKKGLL